MSTNNNANQRSTAWTPSPLERGGVRLSFFGLILLLFPLIVAAQREAKAPQMTIPEYITKYSEIAKAEMRRAGVPASITLAQGILESSYGNSKLSTVANNHFGIKCGSNWKGPTFIQDDDTEKECFRKYESVLHSYADHSNFLKGKERYVFLFELSPKDYEGWAKGLQKAGYATNPNYATLLIRLIEERDLHRFDTEQKYAPLTKAEEEYFSSVQDKFYMFNGIKTVIAQPNEMPIDMATKYDISLSSLLKYNDLIEGEYIAPGTKIYLETKKSSGFEAFHRVDEGETMHSISQKEGIKLKTLYKKNRLAWGLEPAVGEILCLKKKCDAAPKVKTDEQIKEDIKEKIQTRVDEAVKEEQKKEEVVAEKIEEIKTEEKSKPEIVEEKSVVQETPEPVVETVEEPEVKIEEAPVVEEKPAPVTTTKTSEAKKPKYHTVAPQETLYRIATTYGLTVDEVKKLNGLSSNSISIGQKLIVGYTTETVTEEAVEEKPVIKEKPNNKPVLEDKQPIYHIVAPQETVYKIASKYGISVAELKVMNEITSNELKVGQKLLVGYQGVVSTEPKNEPRQKEAEEVKDVPQEAPVEAPSDQPTYHKVQTGETLYSIAQKYKLNVEQLKTLNNLPSNDIQPGRVLKLR